MNLPQPLTKTFSNLIDNIESGKIKIPQFQRNFVWSVKKSAELMDSIVKGYPIGSFIFWETKERLRSVRNLGGYELPTPGDGKSVNYVLDGQQRMTSLFACLKGIQVHREHTNGIDDFSKIYINLEAGEHDQIVVTEKTNDTEFISIVDLLNKDFDVLAGYPRKYYQSLKNIKNIITSYQYSIIQIEDAPIDIATEVFTRINVGGKSLTLFEIMVAKTFDSKLNFDLLEKYKRFAKTLSEQNYDTISDAAVLHTISLILKNECKRQVILSIDKDEFIDVWDKVIDAMKSAVEYFKNHYRIPASKLLPYNALIVPFAYYFYHKKDKPMGDTMKRMEDFFWRCSLAGRYSSSVESKLAQDIKRIDAIIRGELPSYDWPIDSTKDFIIRNGEFSTGRSYIKAILCIYAYHQPKSFNDNSIVNINNNWLKRANSKNYHHFFPKASFEKSKNNRCPKVRNNGNPINHVLNITIVDDFLNKRVIKTKSPAEYMTKFKKKNSDLNITMKTHLIGDLEEFGIWDNDYNVFFHKRAELISKEIEKRIIKQDIDITSAQSNLKDDYEEEGAINE